MKRGPLFALLFVVAACGDALLPADYAGPPADRVGGVVLFDRTTNAAAPKLSLQWLTAQAQSGRRDGTDVLVDQKLHFARSSALTEDWTIALYQPADGAHTQLVDAPSNVRLLVGKLVYFDDLDGDGRMTWTCTETPCDRLLSVSSEYVVYTARPIRCGSEEMVPGLNRTNNVQLTGGYHYFRYEGDRPEALAVGQALSFLGIDNSPGDAERLVDALDDFAGALVRGLRLDALGGCGALGGSLPAP